MPAKSLFSNENVRQNIEIIEKLDSMDASADWKMTGVIMYIMTGEDRYLQTRNFRAADKKRKWIEQDKKCGNCGIRVDSFQEMHADHVKP